MPVSQRAVTGLIWVALLGATASAMAQAPADVEAFTAIQSEWNKATAEARKRGGALNAATIQSLAQRCVDVKREHPHTAGGLAAVYFAACMGPESEAGREANQLFAKDVTTADLSQFEQAMIIAGVHASRSPDPAAVTPVAAAILDRVRQSSDHPRAARVTAKLCALVGLGVESEQVPPVFSEAADLLIERYSDHADIVNFCEAFGTWIGGARWTHRFEPHLRTILKNNTDRFVRCSAMLALANMIAANHARQDEAQQLYRQFLATFDGEHPYHAQGIEQEYHRLAKKRLDTLTNRGVGQPAPEITGVDLDDHPMALTQYRGKVVLVSFWASWCAPCMAFMPHEKALTERLADKPFAIVGVNADIDEAAAARAVARHKMTWRSFKNAPPAGPTIAAQWQVTSWPTFYLIDHQGVIRKRWNQTPPATAELDAAVDELIEQALKERGAK